MYKRLSVPQPPYMCEILIILLSFISFICLYYRIMYVHVSCVTEFLSNLYFIIVIVILKI